MRIYNNILWLSFSLIWLVGHVGCYQGSGADAADVDRQRRDAARVLAHDAATRLGRDIHYGLQETTCLRAIRNHYRPQRNSPSGFSISSVEWPELHGQIARDMGYAMRWAKESVESIVEEAENLASNHTFRKELVQEYNDVYYIMNSDYEESNSVPNELTDSSLLDPNAINNASLFTEPLVETLPTPDSLQSLGPIEVPTTGQAPQSSASAASSMIEKQQPTTRILKLSPHPNFDDTLVNTEESAVHIPVHLFFGEPQIMNGIVWSEPLTKTFRNNFVQNPTLTNQYFASQDGFLRLFPARKWPIPQNQPDLYDARMRPWYLAGASSRKDVVILVDSSGSMTGSRRDIAKGVVFEILDTLTDNDNFLILKFSDSVQQVGVPSCPGLRVERVNSSIPLRNTLFTGSLPTIRTDTPNNNNDTTDYASFYLTQASGKNIRHIKSNFTIPTAGIANFSRALVTAFEVLANYQQSTWSGAAVQCNQAIMLITDGAPSDFMDIFARYNVPNAPVRVFTYLIGREAGDVTNTKMMACHNRGFYTHVINLAEVRETVQQYIPVMARPLVLNGTHPVLWTPAYGDLTYQVLTDWVWESRRRDKVRAAVRGQRGGGGGVAGGSVVLISNEESGSMEDELYDPNIDLFGYNSNPSCFWETNRNDLLTTVVQPVYDRRTETNVTEKFLYKNVWTIRETLRRTAKILGVAAADMRINNLMSFASSHKLGVNAYPILLTNNGFVMHHPGLRSILEPKDASDKDMRIMKPFFSSMDFSEVEHVLDGLSQEPILMTLRREAILGLTGFRKLATKRMFDCNKRVQTREQNFYYKPIDQFPFSFIIATPEPYGSRRIDATIDIKTARLPEKLMSYFNPGGGDQDSNMEFLSVHSGYKYCVGPSNNTVATLLDMIGRIDMGNTNDIQWKPSESTKPPIFLPGKIVCDKNLVESLVYDAVATFNFSQGCLQPSPSAESSLLGMFGVRFAFVSTRSGLLRVRYFDYEDERLKREAATFARKHDRGVDETFYSRTADYNMLNNRNATVIQVPFNTHDRIRQKLEYYKQTMAADNLNAFEPAPGESSSPPPDINLSLEESLRDVLTNASLHVIATQSIIGEEGPREAVAGVTGVFYDFASFVIRFFKLANERLAELKSSTCLADGSCEPITCGSLADDTDCMLIDNNGYIVVSENLSYIGRSLKTYEPSIIQTLVEAGVYHEVNVTDYQAICEKHEEKQPVSSSGISSKFNHLSPSSVLRNLVSAVIYAASLLSQLASAATLIQYQNPSITQRISRDSFDSISSFLPNKTYLRPCKRTHILYETRAGHLEKGDLDYHHSLSNSSSWFIFEQVPNTNLIMLVVKLRGSMDPPPEGVSKSSWVDIVEIDEQDEASVCAKLERDWKLDKKRIDTCFSHHPDEDNIKLCDSAQGLTNPNRLIVSVAFLSVLINLSFSVARLQVQLLSTTTYM